MSSMLFCLLSGVKTQEKIKITELERRVLAKAECVEGGDECDYQPRCGTSEETVRRD